MSTVQQLFGIGLVTVGLVGAFACSGDDTDTGPTGGTGGTTTSSSTTSTTTTSNEGGTGGVAATGGGGAGVGGSGGGAEGGASACTPVTITDFIDSDFQTDPGGSSLFYTLVGLDETQEHVLFIEFYDVGIAQAAGSFDLSQAPDDNYSTCAHCLYAWENASGDPTTEYFQASGTLVVTTPDTTYNGASAGTFDNVTLVEVTVTDTVSTPVEGGKCMLLTGGWDHTT
jgi:hypothetical protein